MGAAVLPYCLISLPIASPLPYSKQSLSFAVFSSLPTSPFNSNPTPISAVSSSAFRPAVLSPVVRLAKKSKSTRLNSSSEETEAAVEETLETKTTEEEAELAEVAEEEPKPPRKPIIKLGDIMGILNKRAVEASEKERPVPDIRTGDVVEITLEVPENRRRASKYKGIVMSKQNAGIHTTIRIRRIIAGIGVEIVFPVYSPNIKELKVVSHRKVRRARLYYLRDKLPRLSTFK